MVPVLSPGRTEEFGEEGKLVTNLLWMGLG